MFWELAAEGVFRRPTDLSCANVEREWKHRKYKMEKASKSVSDRKQKQPRNDAVGRILLRNEDEEKRVGSKFAACMWIYTKEALTKG